MGIRARIIFSFLSLLIAPFMVVFLALVVLNSNAFGGPISETIADLSAHSTHVADVFKSNFSSVDDPQAMDAVLAPAMKNKFRRVLYADPDRLIHYDSSGLLIGKSLADLSTPDADFDTYDVDITISGEYKGTLILIPDLDLVKAFKLLLALPVVLIILFILTIIALIFILSKILADGIISPLRELNYGAERIAAGDLDFEMTYTRDDEFGKLCQEFDHMRLKLKESLSKQVQYEKSRRQLIASISHDLKTPLTSIKGYVEGLQDGLVTDESTYQRYLRVIWDKSNRLNHLIDDLFIFSKMELGEFKIEPGRASSRTLLEDILSTREMELADHDVSFNVSRPIPDVPLWVDEHRMGQIMDNLIDNALKFTTSRIDISAKFVDHQLAIYVSDDGIGMSEEDLPYIFDHFYKIDKARSSQSIGTGLGLAICKELVEAHRGTIHVKSRVGRGTTFLIMLPVSHSE